MLNMMHFNKKKYLKICVLLFKENLVFSKKLNALANADE